jgi:hypothetical protein
LERFHGYTMGTLLAEDSLLLRYVNIVDVARGEAGDA